MSALLMDELTEAYLRGPGLRELGREVAKAHRTGHPFSVAFIDVDGLKATNDSAGHDAGDRRLAQVAQTVTGSLREYEVVVRYGGDEFVCGLDEADLDAAPQRFDRVSDDLARSSAASASVGVVQLDCGEGLEDLIKRAEEAMYAARAPRSERSSGLPTADHIRGYRQWAASY